MHKHQNPTRLQLLPLSTLKLRTQTSNSIPKKKRTHLSSIAQHPRPHPKRITTTSIAQQQKKQHTRYNVCLCACARVALTYATRSTVPPPAPFTADFSTPNPSHPYPIYPKYRVYYKILMRSESFGSGVRPDRATPAARALALNGRTHARRGKREGVRLAGGGRGCWGPRGAEAPAVGRRFAPCVCGRRVQSQSVWRQASKQCTCVVADACRFFFLDVCFFGDVL